jgi:hypothetical protein
VGSRSLRLSLLQASGTARATLDARAIEHQARPRLPSTCQLESSGAIDGWCRVLRYPASQAQYSAAEGSTSQGTIPCCPASTGHQNSCSRSPCYAGHMHTHATLCAPPDSPPHDDDAHPHTRTRAHAPAADAKPWPRLSVAYPSHSSPLSRRSAGCSRPPARNGRASPHATARLSCSLAGKIAFQGSRAPPGGQGRAAPTSSGRQMHG